MRLYPTRMLVLSAAVLGVVAAACSSKSEDSGNGNVAANGSLGGGSTTAAGQGGSASTTTGGYHAAVGGQTSVSNPAGGAFSGGLPAACPGLPLDPDAGNMFGGDAGEECPGVGVEIESTPLDMYVMMDRTQSMTYKIENTAMQRWDVLQSGVQSFITDPTVLNSPYPPRVGLQFFGAGFDSQADPRECSPATYATPQIEIEAIATSGPKILAAVQAERDALGGLTPWFPALQGALTHAQDWHMANQNRMTVVVLVTDGYPTECEQDVSVIQSMVGEYYSGVAGQYNTRGAPGIRTYVIGVAVNHFNVDGIAQAGGTHQATIVDGANGISQFVNAMVNITKDNISCSIKLPTPPSGKTLDPTRVSVVYKPSVGEPQEFPLADSANGCASANGGWYFDNPSDPKSITFCPCSCANLGAGSITVRFGCRPIKHIG